MDESRTHFIKYHGLGNDFAIFAGGMGGAPPLTAAEARALCRRGAGVGADGVALARPSARAAVAMELTNSDGSLPEMCGNGLRCFVKYAVEELGLSDNPLLVETPGGLKPCWWTAGGDGKVTRVKVDMGAPTFARAAVPMTGTGDALEVDVPCGDRTFVATGVNTGNPHMVIFGDASLGTAKRWGPALTAHPMWPEGANVEFAALRADGAIDLTVFERGCGLTQACGTGATATAAAAIRLGRRAFDQPILVHLPGGELEITVAADFRTAWMEGPAVEVYRASIAPGWWRGSEA
jgi:diaminopimelate epimerase